MPTPSDPRDPRTILATCQQIVEHMYTEQVPALWTSISQLPARTLQRYAERDRKYEARQGAIGDPFRGWIDPGLADDIDERRQRYDEYLKKKREAASQDEEKNQ